MIYFSILFLNSKVIGSFFLHEKSEISELCNELRAVKDVQYIIICISEHYANHPWRCSNSNKIYN